MTPEFEIQSRPPGTGGPTSFGQLGFWLVVRLAPENPLSLLSAGRFLGRLDVGALGLAVGEVVARHESLRTSFVEVDGEPVQRVGGVGRWVLEVVDVVGGEEEVRRVAGVEALVPFDLGRGSLLRTRLLRLGVEDHVLLVTMHHIVSDGWSLGVFWRELGVLYRAFAAGEGSPLAPLPVQYADFAVWQREWLSGERLAGLLGYWRERLAGAPGVLELPVDRVRPAVQSFAGGEVSFVLPAEVGVRLRGVARGRRATLFMVLLAAFKVLLVRYTGQCDVVVGTPIAGRNREELEGLIGFFVNTLVLRTDCSGDPGFAELVDRVRETAIGAYAHQDLPFERLVEELHPARDLSRNPLTQMLVQLVDPSDYADGDPGDVVLEGFSVSPAVVQFELETTFCDFGGSIVVSISYARELFDADTVERFAGHFRNVLECVSSAPGTRLSQVAMLSRGELDQLVVGWNATGREFPARCVHELFEEQVARAPDAVAVEFGGQALSYAQLNARANQVAHRLRRAGVGPEMLVGICLERSLEMVVGLLGILKAGGAYVPLDPDYPPRRLEFMLADTAAEVVVTSAGLAPLFPGQHTVLLPSGGALAGEPEHNPGRQAHPANLAYVIYTSGSTGQPKGVAAPHTGNSNLLQWLQTEYRLTPDDHLLYSQPFSFVGSVAPIFWPLTAGAKVVSARAKEYVDPSYISQLISDRRITAVLFVPALLEVLATEDAAQSWCSVRLALSSGDVLPGSLCDRIANSFGMRLDNVYGATETSADATFWTCAPVASDAAPIGQPIANTRVYVLDGSLQLVPPGVVGDIYVAGSCLARGYHDRPWPTAGKFVACPFGAPGERMYRTGDLGLWRKDGNLHFAGRADDQVKVRGIRVELGEIESRLRAQPGVLDACVVPAPDSEWPSDALIGFVEAHHGEALTSEDLLTYLAQELPKHMIPASVVVGPLPRTSSGKVARPLLVRPAPVAPSGATPLEGIEERVARIWERLLGAPISSREQDFFGAGGSSLQAVRMVTILQRELGMALEFKTLFRDARLKNVVASLRFPDTTDA